MKQYLGCNAQKCQHMKHCKHVETPQFSEFGLGALESLNVE